MEFIPSWTKKCNCLARVEKRRGARQLFCVYQRSGVTTLAEYTRLYNSPSGVTHVPCTPRGKGCDRVHEGADGVDGGREGRTLVVIEGDLDDALVPARADDRLHADIAAGDAVLATELGAAGEHDDSVHGAVHRARRVRHRYAMRSKRIAVGGGRKWGRLLGEWLQPGIPLVPFIPLNPGESRQKFVFVCPTWGTRSRARR